MSETKMFTAKVEEHLLDAFKRSCQVQDTTASQAVRAFMREYVAEHGQGDLFAKPKPKRQRQTKPKQKK